MERSDNTLIPEDAKKTARRDVKNSVFIDLFNIPKYQLLLFQALHPEITDVTVDDIELITLNPVLLNMMYNDLGMLIKDRLLIFVEAQSTWSINILIRILMYLAYTYQEYITGHEMNVYGSKQIEIPKPEFYVIYTGNKKIEKDTLSLRDDFFRDPESSVDLKVKIIYAENKDDIIGQYIIFCHDMDEQIKLHGRTKRAVESAIRISRLKGVLKEYLNNRQKEVIDVMITLFDQEYAVDAYARDLAKEAAEKAEKKGLEEGEIKATIEMCMEYGEDALKTTEKIVAKFHLTQEDAAKYIEKYWTEME